MRQLSERDARLLRSDVVQGNVSSTGVYIFDPATAPGGELSYESILQHIELRLQTSPVFRRRLVGVPLDLDRPYWLEDDDFELEDHVRHVALPKPGDWQQFCTLAARVHARPLDLSRPLWEMYVVEGLDNVDWLPKGSLALLTKIHHAATDGVSGTELMAGLLDASLPPRSRAPILPWTGEDDPHVVELLLRTYCRYLASPLRALQPVTRALASITPQALGFYSGLLMRHPGVHLTRFNGEVSSRRVWESRAFALKDAKAIKDAVPGTTVHDVVLAICGGALRCYLQEKGELPETTLKGLVPIVLDPAGRDRRDGALVSFVHQELHTNLVDPLERLAAIGSDTQRSEVMAHAIDARDLADVAKHAPSETLALASRVLTLELADRAGSSPLAHCCVTNVPGPQVPLYLAGAKMVYLSGLAPLSDGLGLQFVINSYDGRLVISVTSCREILPDPGTLARCIEGSFTELKAAACDPDRTARPRGTHSAPAAGRRRTETPAVGGHDRATHGGRAGRPSLIHGLLEGRAVLEVASIPLALPLLASTPRGDGHPVMVLPGFSADDGSTMLLRFFLRNRGYSVHSWGFARNLGLAGNIEERVASRVRKLEMRSGRKVSLIGHSLGGLIARHVAHDVPESVRQVITLGSPLGLGGVNSAASSLTARLYALVNPESVVSGDWLHLTETRAARWRHSPPVPLTAIYTRSDGAVHWSACLDPRETPSTENVRVPGSHLGLPNNPTVLSVIANRLAQPEGRWQPFPTTGLHQALSHLLDPFGGLP